SQRSCAPRRPGLRLSAHWPLVPVQVAESGSRTRSNAAAAAARSPPHHPRYRAPRCGSDCACAAADDARAMGRALRGSRARVDGSGGGSWERARRAVRAAVWRTDPAGGQRGCGCASAGVGLRARGGGDGAVGWGSGGEVFRRRSRGVTWDGASTGRTEWTGRRRRGRKDSHVGCGRVVEDEGDCGEASAVARRGNGGSV
ncbi:hypothetical protein LTR16_007549, partial [Cryomyces antarcticus]